MKKLKCFFVISLFVCCFVLFSCSDADKDSQGIISNDSDTVCTLTYDDGIAGIEITVENPVSYAPESQVTVASAIEREFYVFIGWSDGRNTYSPGNTVTITQNITLTAVWQLDESIAISQNDLEYIVNEDGTSTLAGFKDGNGSYGINLVIPEKDPDGNSVTAVASEAFAERSELVRVSLPSSVKTIGEKAFYNCSSITELVLAEGLEEIGRYSFYYCAGLREIVIPDSVSLISEHAFRNCNLLEKLTLGKGISSLGESSFRGCSRLAVVTVHETLAEVGNYAFEGCKSIRNVMYPGTQSQWNEIDFGKGNDYFKSGATFAI